MNLTCNATLEHLRISPGSEIKILGPLNFHDLARVIAASCTLIAVALSLYLVWMHALNYTQPREQRHIIRILFMVPVYSIASFLQIQWYWHAIYFQVLSDCYEAIAIASFFSLLCHYAAPDLHTQKDFFRAMRPIKPWVWPLNWFAKCCGGERGPWRTPKSGLTWFNINWTGTYQYCFIRVAMTIAAVMSQYFDKYCESSNSPIFGHIWILIINAVAVTIAMFCLVQFYVQLSAPLAEHKLFIKILAIKLVVFLSFWQSSAISVVTSTLNIVHPNEIIAYPDLKVGTPALLLCVEMALFALLHFWAFPYRPYCRGGSSFYPTADPSKGAVGIEKPFHPPSGGVMGIHALWDALNLWDFAKAFGRGMRWLFCGVKRRKEDVSYKLSQANDEGVNMDSLHEHKPGQGSYTAVQPNPLTDPSSTAYHGVGGGIMPSNHVQGEESAGLIYNAQPAPEATGVMGSPPSAYYPPRQQPSPYQPSYQPPSRHSSPYSQNYPYDPPPYLGAHGPSLLYNVPNHQSTPPPRPNRPAGPYGEGPWRPNKETLG